jgi:hypothetical protein
MSFGSFLTFLSDTPGPTGARKKDEESIPCKMHLSGHGGPNGTSHSRGTLSETRGSPALIGRRVRSRLDEDLRKICNVIQLGNHAAIQPHISHLSGINGRMVSNPSKPQIHIPTPIAHKPAYLHVQYHTHGKTHIVLSNTTKAMRANLSLGNILCARKHKPVMIPVPTSKAQSPKPKHPSALGCASVLWCAGCIWGLVWNRKSGH